MTRALPLLDVLGDVADRHLEEIEACSSPRRYAVLWKSLAVAACLAVTVAAVCAAFSHREMPPTADAPLFAPSLHAPETLSLEELADRADVIITAEVVAEHREWHEYNHQAEEIPYPGTPYTPDCANTEDHTDKAETFCQLLADVRVTEVLKGDVAIGDTLCVTNQAFENYDANGRYLSTFYFADTALLKQGDRVLLFLIVPSYATEDSYLLPIDEAGKWFRDEDGRYYCGVLDDERFPENYTPNFGLDDYTPKTTEDVKACISK